MVDGSLKRLIGACTAAALLACGTASAQDLAGRPRGPVRAGRVSFNPAVRLTSLGIDTNVFNTLNDRKADFTFTVTPQSDALLDFTRFRVLLTGGADFVYFRKYATERSINPNGAGTAELRVLRRSALYVQLSRTDMRDRLNFEVDGRVRRFERATSAGFVLGVSRNLKFQFSGGETRLRFGENAMFRGVELRRTLDRDTRSAEGRVQYALTSLTTAGFTVRVSEDRFIYLPARNTSATDVRLGWTFKPRALLSGEANVGYVRTSTPNDDAPDFRGPVAGVALTYTFREATQFGMGFDRGTGYSFDPQYSYYTFNRYRGSVRRYLLQRVELALEAELQKRAYQDGTTPFATPPGVGPFVDQPDAARHYAARVAVQVARRARVGVEADLFDQARSRRIEGPYRDLRVGLMASYGIFTVGERVAMTR